jgi:hypothetical protein
MGCWPKDYEEDVRTFAQKEYLVSFDPKSFQTDVILKLRVNGWGGGGNSKRP